MHTKSKLLQEAGILCCRKLASIDCWHDCRCAYPPTGTSPTPTLIALGHCQQSRRNLPRCLSPPPVFFGIESDKDAAPTISPLRRTWQAPPLVLLAAMALHLVADNQGTTSDRVVYTVAIDLAPTALPPPTRVAAANCMPRSGANKKSRALRLEAADIWRSIRRRSKRERRKEAASEFERRFPGAVTRPGAFCQHWGERLYKEYSVHDKQRSGRRRALAPSAAAAAAALLRAPEQQPDWPQNGYKSVAQACSKNAELEAIRRAASGGKGCSHKTLWRAAKRADPSLRLNPLRFKPPLSAANRQKRFQHAKKNLRQWRQSRQYYK